MRFKKGRPVRKSLSQSGPALEEPESEHDGTRRKGADTRCLKEHVIGVDNWRNVG